jgi:hypothetical protein
VVFIPFFLLWLRHRQFAVTELGHAQGARCGYLALEETFACEAPQVLDHAERGRDPQRIAELEHGRRVSAPLDAVENEPEHLALALG